MFRNYRNWNLIHLEPTWLPN